MTTAKDARQAARALLEANVPLDKDGNKVTLNWPGENSSGLADIPAPFVFSEFINDQGRIITIGGGKGLNRYRTFAVLNCYVFTPRGQGQDPPDDIAEQICTLFRSYRDSNISCWDATPRAGGDGASLKPPGMSSEVDNYFWACAQITLHYDQIG